VINRHPLMFEKRGPATWNFIALTHRRGTGVQMQTRRPALQRPSLKKHAAICSPHRGNESPLRLRPPFRGGRPDLRAAISEDRWRRPPPNQGEKLTNSLLSFRLVPEKEDLKKREGGGVTF